MSHVDIRRCSLCCRFAQVLSGAKQGASEGSEQDAQALKDLSLAVGDFFGGAGSGETGPEAQVRSFHSLPPLKVTRQEGFVAQVGDDTYCSCVQAWSGQSSVSFFFTRT